MPQPDNTDPDDVLIDMRQDMDRRREDYAAELKARALGMETDPLLLALQEAKQAREQPTGAHACSWPTPASSTPPITFLVAPQWGARPLELA
ncbi:hypothetical protein [Streptomyces sp. A1136]|uniref:hypothetical protein n=1 Tax=Streptomyces sp. A1136 TaxID=2563102 RepID=UPI00109EDF92|nr:hypothetical protein [Streptomyces sp. A1136]THA51644.1 hypothetical protein E6R62_22360 [Streptomyces sp. A1136]